MATVSPAIISDHSQPNGSLHFVANSNREIRRTSSLPSFGPSLLPSVDTEAGLCFPVLETSVPDRRTSSDWNEFISLGMSDDKEGNPMRSIAARGRLASKSGLGRSPIVPGSGEWERMMSSYDFEKDAAGPSAGPLTQSFGDLPYRRDSVRLNPIAFAPSQTNFGRTIYGSEPIATPPYADVIPLVPIPKPLTKAAVKRAGKVPKKSAAALRKGPDYVGRPANAWILYRSEQIRILKSENSVLKKPQSDISKFIALMWRDETVEVRKHFEAMADIKKAEHQAMYPDYRFCPKRKEAKNKPSAARLAVITTYKPVAKAVNGVTTFSTRPPLPPPQFKPVSPKSYAEEQPLRYGASLFPSPYYERQQQQQRQQSVPPPSTSDVRGEDPVLPRHADVPGMQDYLASVATAASYNQRQDPRSQFAEAENWSNYDGSWRKWHPSTDINAHLTARSAPTASGSSYHLNAQNSDLPIPPLPHSHLNFAVPFPGLNVNIQAATNARSSEGQYAYQDGQNYQYSNAGTDSGIPNAWSQVSPRFHDESYPVSAPAAQSSAAEQRQIFQIPQASFNYASSSG